MTAKSKTSTRIPIDDSCFDLLTRVARKTHTSVNGLANISAEAFIGSLKNYGLDVPITEIKATVGGNGTNYITLSKRAFNDLSKAGVYLGVPLASMMRDAILGQRFNFQRMQPVNARSMPSVRMTLFRIEQGGEQAQA